MKLRNRQSYITTLPEGESPEKQAPKITRWIYFLLLFSIIGYLVSIGYAGLTQFQGRGQVEVEKTVLSPSHGGQVTGLFVEKGKLIKKGSAIVQIKASIGCSLEDTGRINKLKFDIALKKSQLGSLNKRLSEEEIKLDDQVVRRALEIDRRSTKGIDRAISDLNYKTEALKNEIRLGEESLRNLNSTSAISKDSACQDEVIYAPFTSVVNSISKKRYEFATRGIPLVSLIRKNALVQIEAYIDNESDQYVSVNKKVEVIFPDKQIGQGIISEIISSSAFFQTRKWRGYESEESKVAINISPINASEAQKWKVYDRMEVQIRGLK